MDHKDDVSTDENVLTFNISDDALERAVGRAEGQVCTLNFRTYAFYQGGPIGSRHAGPLWVKSGHLATSNTCPGAPRYGIRV